MTEERLAEIRATPRFYSDGEVEELIAEVDRLKAELDYIARGTCPGVPDCTCVKVARAALEGTK